MSADEDPQTQQQVLHALRRPGPYQNEKLAHNMERALPEEQRETNSGAAGSTTDTELKR